MWEVLLTKLTALIALGMGTLLIVIFPWVDKLNKHISFLSILVGVLIIAMLFYWIIVDESYRLLFFGV